MDRGLHVLKALINVGVVFLLSQDEASDLKLRLASLVKQTVELHERRSALYQSYEDAINKFKSSKDASAFKNAQKRIDADHKQLTQQVTALHLKLKTEGSDSAEKVRLPVPSCLLLAKISMIDNLS